MANEFARRWKANQNTERSASQSQFLDICALIGAPGPNAADSNSEWYAFEKGAEKAQGGDGWADVWMKGQFGWEYKGHHKDLKVAYSQLLNYKDALDNPPLLVVSDMNQFEIHTNFTGTVHKVCTFSLDDFETNPTKPLGLLKRLFTDPESFRPGVTREEITQDMAKHFAEWAESLRARGNDPQEVAHFVNQIVFSFFAEDADLLPKGLLLRLVEGSNHNPEAFHSALTGLFAMMSDKGGMFGVERIEWFGGELFAGAKIPPLVRADLDQILESAKRDWADIEPSIFGTLFERGLDPGNRTQLGAHYTDARSIDLIVTPVLIAPLHAEFAAMKVQVDKLLTKGKPKLASKAWQDYLERVRTTTVLDPACGSGNFLYVSLRALKDLEHEAIGWGSEKLQVPMDFPQVGPKNVKGIEINWYASELAKVTIWIGEIQWMMHHGYSYNRNPILGGLAQVEHRDALLNADFTEASWPKATVIVGNPPFLGSRELSDNLGETISKALKKTFKGRLAGVDLCCYWFEKARAMIEQGDVERVGLLATQNIRAGSNRRVLERIKKSGDIFLAWPDETWWDEKGASVHVALVGYDNGTTQPKQLNGGTVATINANLTAGIDLTQARRLVENQGVSFVGDVSGDVGMFVVSDEIAHKWLDSPNPDARSNRKVLKPWMNGRDVAGRPSNSWIVDFDANMSRVEASLYEAPFEHVLSAAQVANKKTQWWTHLIPGAGMRVALAGLSRYLVTPGTAKYHPFVWMSKEVLMDVTVVVIAREDDYTFGIMNSGIHQLWMQRTGNQLRELESGSRYRPTRCFQTFPFPQATEEQKFAVAEAAKRLDSLRSGWLNPAGLSLKDLKARTLTNLYNKVPTWLTDCHQKLDAAVAVAYGWSTDLPDEEILVRLLILNLQRPAV